MSPLPICARVVVAACALWGMSACDQLRGTANPETPSWFSRPNGAMKVVLRSPLTVPERVNGEDYERGQPEIDAAHRRVFVGSSDRGLYALRATDGLRLWRFETLGPVQCEPLYDPAEDSVYFGSNDGALYKVRASDGTLIWRFNSNAEVSRRPVLAHGLLYVVNANDTLLAIEPQTGRLRWMRHRTPAQGMEVAGYAGPLVTSERVYAAFSDGHVAAFDPIDGSEKWPSVDLSAEVEQAIGDVPKYLDVDTTPVLDPQGAKGSVLLVASYAGGVFALDAATGSRVWTNDQPTGVTELVLWEEPAHADRDGQGPTLPGHRILLAASGTSGLWGLSPTDGQKIWRKSIPDGGMSAPIPVAGALIASTTRYGVFLLSPFDGGVIDGLEMAGGLAMTPRVYGRRAFVMSNAGTLLGIQVDPPGML